MFHGEIGLDTLYGLSQISEISDHDLKTVNLFSRKLKLVFPDEATAKVGSASGNLLKHSKKFSALLDSDCESLADHAWLACAFSFARAGRQVSSGAAAATADGNIFRAGEIEDVISAQEAAIVGMRANGREPGPSDAWATCDAQGFTEHRWYPRFLDLASK